MKRTRKFFAILLVLSMLLTACGTFAAGKDTVNLVLNGAVLKLNPYDTAATIDMQLFCQIYEPLFYRAPNGELTARLATGYEIEDDGMTYVIHLRDDVKFHNGKPMTAEDVAWSVDYCLKSGPYAGVRGMVPGYDSVEIVDAATVKIKTAEPSKSFFGCLNAYVDIVCKEEYLAAVENGTIGVEWVPFGTGPYTIESYRPDAEITLKAFPDYYRGKAAIENIDYKILTDNNTITISFEAGDLDLIAVPTASFGEISSMSEFTTELIPGTHTSFFLVNVDEGPLANKLVRQAISYALYRDEIVVGAYDGLGQPAYSLFNPDTVEGAFTPEELEAAGIPSYQYNPEKAKELLAEAGYPDGVDIGTITCINSSYWEKMSTIAQSELAAVGITVNIELQDSSACRNTRKAHTYNLATTGCPMEPDASHCDVYFKYVDPNGSDVVTELSSHDKVLADMLIDASKVTDPEAWKAAYLEINRYIQDAMYIIPTFYKATPYAYDKDLSWDCDAKSASYVYVYDMHWN